MKNKSLNIFGKLFMEQDTRGNWGVSAGRIAFWLVFLPALWIWLQNINIAAGAPLKDISANHYYMLCIMSAYNFGKKVKDAIVQHLASKGQSGMVV